MRSKPQNTARGTPGDGGLAVATLRKVAGPGWKLAPKLRVRAGPVRGRVALVPRGAKVRGSIATPASRAPSDFFPEAQMGSEVELPGGPGACSNNTGSVALA